jgi:hypothetical protein
MAKRLSDPVSGGRFRLEHRAEKWEPVFRKKDAATKT